MQEARDDVYCHLIARRAVARAALHLGLDAMSQEALDAMGGVLCAYLERFGKAMALQVESCGRSSAHCHAIDALRAAELVTAPAVQRVHQMLAGDDGANASSGDRHNPAINEPSQDVSWKGLAAFCFGPQWMLEPSSPEGQSARSGVAAGGRAVDGGGGGKVGPSANEASAASALPVHGWNAPYPDELPEFPSTQRSQALLAQRVSESLHAPRMKQQPAPGGGTMVTKIPLSVAEAGDNVDDANDLLQELQDMPDSAFTEDWGSLFSESKKPPASAAASPSENGAAKRKSADEKDGAADGDPSAKRAKQDAAKKKKKSVTLVESKKKKAAAAAAAVSPAVAAVQQVTRQQHPQFVPVFFPNFPCPSDSMGRTVVDAQLDDSASAATAAAATDTKKQQPVTGGSAAAASADPSLQVRSALVTLGETPQGESLWGTGWETKTDKSLTNVQLASGRSADQAFAPPIVPLGRASGSRVSRILEGSMDTNA